MKNKTHFKEVVNEPVEEVVNEPVEEVVNEIQNDLYVTVAVPKLNIREDSDPKAKILGIVNQDEKLKLLSMHVENGFYNVKTENGLIGYCMVKFVK